MATFEVRKERVIIDCDTKSLFDSALEKRKQYEILARFNNIFTSIGLTLYLFPYVVTATATGVKTSTAFSS